MQSGIYQAFVAASSQDIRLHGSMKIEGEPINIPEWLAGSWYETLQGDPSREEWERTMGYPVAVIPEAKRGQFTMDYSCLEMKDESFSMKIQYKVTESIIAKSFGGKKDYSNPSFKMMMVCATDCPLRATIISSGGTMSDSLAQGLLEMANGHYNRGIKAVLMALRRK